MESARPNGSKTCVDPVTLMLYRWVFFSDNYSSLLVWKKAIWSYFKCISINRHPSHIFVRTVWHIAFLSKDRLSELCNSLRIVLSTTRSMNINFQVKIMDRCPLNQELSFSWNLLFHNFFTVFHCFFLFLNKFGIANNNLKKIRDRCWK